MRTNGAFEICSVPSKKKSQTWFSLQQQSFDIIHSVMSAKTLKPLSSLFQQWSSQQQQESSPSRSYRILLQSTNGLSTRIQAAEAVENPHLYRRANVRTPPENAIRDSQGGYSWLEHLVELAQKHHDHILWVGIKTQPSTITTKLLSADNNNSTTTVIQVSKDPWGWDDTEENEKLSLNDLQGLYTNIQNRMQTSSSILIFESLTQLITVHGFTKTLAFLNKFYNCLQIWPINTEILTPLQHQALEDCSQALLYLNEGEMTMIRQGIREKGNIIRQSLPFKLDVLGKLEEVEEQSDKLHQSQHPQETDQGNDKKSLSLTTQTTSSDRMPTTKSHTHENPKIELKLEDDNNEVPKASQQSQTNNRPRIFLQDDDPEFDDLDDNFG